MSTWFEIDIKCHPIKYKKKHDEAKVQIICRFMCDQTSNNNQSLSKKNLKRWIGPNKIVLLSSAVNPQLIITCKRHAPKTASGRIQGVSLRRSKPQNVSATVYMAAFKQILNKYNALDRF